MWDRRLRFSSSAKLCSGLDFQLPNKQCAKWFFSLSKYSENLTFTNLVILPFSFFDHSKLLVLNMSFFQSRMLMPEAIIEKRTMKAKVNSFMLPALDENWL